MSVTLAVTVQDGSLGLTDLPLTRANGYRIVRDGLGPGARLWRRQTVESPYVHGRILVGQSLDAMVATLHVRVEGSSAAQLETRMGALLAAMEQPAYVLEVVVDGVTYQWQCECADSAVGDAGLFGMFEMAEFQQVLRFTVPRQPVPLDGPL